MSKNKAVMLTLYQFTTTPLPPGGGVIAPDPAEPLPEGAVSAGDWRPVSATPVPTQGGMGVVVVWTRPIKAPKEEAKATEVRPPGGLVATATPEDRARFGIR